MHLLSRFRLVIILLVVVLLIGLALTLGLRKTVTLSIDGEATPLITYAFTVGSLLHQQDISLSPADALSPSPDAWLKRIDTVTLQHAIPVQILHSGELISSFSTARAPSDLLVESGITLHQADQVLSNGLVVDPDLPFPAGAQSISLQVIPSINFTITDEGEQRTLASIAPTLGSALWSAGYRFFSTDALFPSVDAPLTSGLSAVLQRSRPVTVQSQDGTISLRTTAETVGVALADAQLSLQGLDYSEPPPEAAIPVNGLIRLVRVTEEVLVEQTPLPFETEYQPVDDLELDSQSIVQAGEYGLDAQRVRVRYEDGEEVSRQVEGQWIAREPQSRIIGYGTLVTLQTEVVDGIQIQYWRKLNMYATSYHPSEVGGTTASGLPLQKGVAAIDINYIPFGTQMYIPGYGEAVAADIGGGVAGRWIDLGYSDYDYEPWHQWVTVYFLWPPPGNIVWIIP